MRDWSGAVLVCARGGKKKKKRNWGIEVRNRRDIPKKGTSWTDVHANGGAVPSNTTHTWPVVSWQKAASVLVKEALYQTRTPSWTPKVVVMEPTVGLVQKGW